MLSKNTVRSAGKLECDLFVVESNLTMKNAQERNKDSVALRESTGLENQDDVLVAQGFNSSAIRQKEK